MIAAVLAMGTGLLTFQYLSSVGRHQTAAIAPRRVVVALRDIPARLVITPEMLTSVMRPGDAIDPDALNDPANAIGRTAAVSIPAGSTVTASKVVAQASQTLETRVPRGMRAIAIPVDRVKGVADLVQPGDHVDVIAVTSPRAGGAPRVATVLRDVAVLAVGTNLESAQGATPAPDNGYQTATLAVSPSQAAMLVLVDLNATLRLTLRPPQDASRRPLTGEKLDLSQAAPPVPVIRAPAAAPVPPPPPAAPVVAARPAAPPVPQGPQIIEGDKVRK